MKKTGKIALALVTALTLVNCGTDVARDTSSPLNGRIAYAPTALRDTSSYSPIKEDFTALAKKYNFAELEKEYKSFSTKALADTYVKKMFNKFLIVTPNSVQVIRQVEFSRYLKNNGDTSYETSLKNIFTDTPLLYSTLTGMPAVQSKMTSESGTFGFYILGVSPNQTVPTALPATNITSTSFTANWSAVTGATSYILIVDGVEITGITGTNHSVTGLQFGTSHTYKVKAVVSGVPGNASNQISIITLLPAPVASAATGASQTSFTANWALVTGATGYEVVVTSMGIPVQGSPFSVAGNVLTKQIADLSPDTIYSWKVRAIRDSINSEYSSAQNVITLSTIAFPSNVILVKSNAPGAGNGTTWANAYTSLQSALSAATSGKEIWVAAGTYKPGTNVTDTFQLKNGVAIYGGFAGTEATRLERNFNTNITILSGDLNDSNSANDGDSYHIITGVTGGIIDGVTIRFGYANGSSPHDSGAGMYNDNSSPTVSNVIFSNNAASAGGGGMYNYNYSSPTVTNALFSGNSVPSTGGGMYNYEHSSPVVTNSIFYNNSANWGGGMNNHNSSSPVITNVLFSGNSTSSGGAGMVNYDSSPAITNATFYNNSATTSGGALLNVVNSFPVIKNSIIWGNSAPTDSEIYNGTSSPTVTYSNIQGGYAGAGNINADPLFVNTSDLDGSDNILRTSDDGLALQSVSPARNTGTNTIAPATDITGTVRPQGILTDMGAYEYNNSQASFSSCKFLKDRGINADGIYTIDSDGSGGNASFQAYCDMTTNGGGWTLVSHIYDKDNRDDILNDSNGAGWGNSSNTPVSDASFNVPNASTPSYTESKLEWIFPLYSNQTFSHNGNSEIVNDRFKWVHPTPSLEFHKWGLTSDLGIPNDPAYGRIDGVFGNFTHTNYFGFLIQDHGCGGGLLSNKALHYWGWGSIIAYGNDSQNELHNIPSGGINRASGAYCGTRESILNIWVR